LAAFRPQRWTPAGSPEEAALPVDFYATRAHYIDHLAPVWRAMRKPGRFCAPDHLHEHLRSLKVKPSPESALAEGGGPIAFSAYGDMARCVKSGRHLILFEHGAGFSFSNAHSSYAGGAHERSKVSLFCEVNEWSARRNRARYPGCRSIIVGSPKMDALAAAGRRRSGKTVCISFHWDCIVAPETRSALKHYRGVLPELARRFDLVMHSHPRIAGQARELADQLGVEYIERFEDVCERADLYVNDASSTLYEFAATGRPVVVLNAPWYRRRVNHGLRFWDCSDVGVQCDEPDDLASAVEDALADTKERAERRREVTARVYPNIGEAAAAAAHVLDSFHILVTSGRMYPRKPEPLPEGCYVVCEGETREDVLRWHGVDSFTDVLSDAKYIGRLGDGVRLSGSLEPAFRALAAGWDHVAIPCPYDYRASKSGPRLLAHDERAVFSRVGAPDDGPTWLLDASFALEMP